MRASGTYTTVPYNYTRTGPGEDDATARLRRNCQLLLCWACPNKARQGKARRPSARREARPGAQRGSWGQRASGMSIFGGAGGREKVYK